MEIECEIQLGPPERSPKVDVLVVGAGISGLVTAYRLLEKDPSLRIRILEADVVIGGNLLQSPLGEIGAKWLEESQTHMHQLLHRLGVSTRQRTIVDETLPRCWELDESVSANLAKYELQRYIKELQLKTPFFKPGRFSIRKDSTKMERHIKNRLFFNESRKFMTNLVELVCGSKATNITYKEFMSLCYGCGGLQNIINIYLECPNTLLEFDSTQLLKALTQRLQHTEILLSRRVKSICHYKDYVEVHDSTQDIHTTDALIFAIPLNCLQQINIAPPVPVELRKVMNNKLKAEKSVTSFIASYSDGHWRKAGYSGNFLKTEPLILGYEYRPNVYVGMMVHDNTMDALVRAIVLDALAQNFGDEMKRPHSYNQHTFELSNLAHVPLTTPWHRVIWSSSAAASTCYRGFLGGAVQSGLRAAMNALLIVRPQTVTWTDVADVHCQNCPNIKSIGVLQLWMSGLNLYNVGYYSLYASSVLVALQLAYKKFG
ncbi:putative flavin-containing monoamine oxidase AofH [Anastrepha ludens]|uniref:putative flavin-containing monoamine oxidase AofH n=1 Tax=Anastrepha ludens TaxID=28586 RepID=UPI0023B0581A|nr:putative flavin-containing monoamine oxidase AofH [Anastrepha ludens]